MTDIAGALASARAAFDLLKVAVDARDQLKLQAAMAELQSKLMDSMSAGLAAAEKAAALQAQLLGLEREKAEIERQLREREQYALHELVPGAFVYASKLVAQGNGVPLHYLCQPCFDKGVKSVLRRIEGHLGLSESWMCVMVDAHSIHR